MTNEIISYIEMCQREGTSLQRGMNFGLGRNYSVVLMSIRANAPYNDRIEDDGTTLIYEGHNVPKSKENPSPETVDQRARTPRSSLTENGKFFAAVESFKKHKRRPEQVKVYQKLRSGIWSYNGAFHLVDAWREKSANRLVFKFKLIPTENKFENSTIVIPDNIRRRIIPPKVKLEVWQRDRGRCVVCDASDELHFDHILPFSKGGTSLRAENVQLLCARHNLEKGDKII